MLWILLGIIAAASWSFAAFIDNYLTDVIFRDRTPQAVKLASGPVYMIISIIIFLVAGANFPEPWQAGLLMLSGAISSVGTIAYYQALKHEEATGAAIFYQLQPIMFLIIDFLIFNESITLKQIAGFMIILSAPIIVVFSRKRKKSRSLEITAALLLVLYVFIATISAEISTRTSAGMNFIQVICFYLFSRGLTDCLFAFVPSYRKRHNYVAKRYKLKYFVPVVIDITLCAAADFAYRYSLIIGIAALSSAITNAAELILTFLFGIILSIIWPKFGREKLRRHLIIAHIIAVILCVAGIIIIQ